MLTAPLVPTGTYFVRVRARNALGLSQPSTQIQVVVSAVAPSPGCPGPPRSLTASGAGGLVTLTCCRRSVAARRPTTSKRVRSRVGRASVPAPPQAFFSRAGVPAGVYYIRIRTVAAGCAPSARRIRDAPASSRPVSGWRRACATWKSWFATRRVPGRSPSRRVPQALAASCRRRSGFWNRRGYRPDAHAVSRERTGGLIVFRVHRRWPSMPTCLSPDSSSPRYSSRLSLRFLRRLRLAGTGATAWRTSVLKADASTSSSLWMSIARHALPSRLELKRRAGSFSSAPLAKVSFTALL